MRSLSFVVVLIGLLAFIGFSGCGEDVTGPGEEGWQLEDEESDSDTDGNGNGDGTPGDGDGTPGDGDGTPGDGDGTPGDGDGTPGDGDGTPGDGDGTPGDGDGTSSDPVYQSEDSIFEVGSLSVNQLVVNDGPYPMLVFLPPGANRYPVLVFHHGFVLANSYYTTLLERVASHGFVVIAPQLYEASFTGLPNTEEEANRALAVYEWLATEGENRLERDLDLSLLGLVGHSRGTKMMYRAVAKEDPGVLGLFGLDPVDGTGGPLGGDPSVMGELSFSGPRFFLGAGLGPVPRNAFSPSCAPEADGYAAFFADAGTPTTLVVATQFGHMDMLNDSTAGCGIICTSCSDGPSRAPMRNYTAAAIVAFFQSVFFDSQAGMDRVTDVDEVSIEITVDAK